MKLPSVSTCALPAILQVHGDVFRPPRHLELLSSLIGTGVQLILLVRRQRQSALVQPAVCLHVAGHKMSGSAG